MCYRNKLYMVFRDRELPELLPGMNVVTNTSKPVFNYSRAEQIKFRCQVDVRLSCCNVRAKL